MGWGKGGATNAYTSLVVKLLGRQRWSLYYNTNIGVKEAGCEDERAMELAQDGVQWRLLVLAVSNFRVLVPEI